MAQRLGQRVDRILLRLQVYRAHCCRKDLSSGRKCVCGVELEAEQDDGWWFSGLVGNW